MYTVVIPIFAYFAWGNLTTAPITASFENSAALWIAQNVNNIARTIDEYTRRIVDSLFAEFGDNVEKIKESFADVARTRAERIAETEIVTASNAGIEIGSNAYDEIETLEKVWVAILDTKVRPSHRSANGQVKSKSEPFVVGGEKLMFPGDRSLGATAKNVINCRCTLKYRKKDG